MTAAGGTVRTGARVTGLTRARRRWQVQTDRRAGAGPPGRVAVPAPEPPGLLAAAVPGAPGRRAGCADRPGADLVTLVLDDPRLDTAPARHRRPGLRAAPRACGPRRSPTRRRSGPGWRRRPARPARAAAVLRAGPADLPPTTVTCPASRWPTPSICSDSRCRRAVVDSAVVRWPCRVAGAPAGTRRRGGRPARVAAEPRGWRSSGSAVAGTGLAAVIGDAREQARRLAEAVDSTYGQFNVGEPPDSPAGEGGWTS